MDLKDFFSAAEARIDRWCEMNTVGRAWRRRSRRDKLQTNCMRRPLSFLAEISPMESYWAYPGSAPDDDRSGSAR